MHASWSRWLFGAWAVLTTLWVVVAMLMLIQTWPEPTFRAERGDVIGNLNSRRGHIQSMETRGGSQVINSRVPLAEMFGYATDIRSRTQGRGSYSMHFDRYEQLPGSAADEIIKRMQGK